MTKHISDELPRLLTGDATHDVVMEAAEHLRICPDCQQELVSSVVAHASLTSAHRFAPEVVAPTPTRTSSLPQSPLAPVARIHGPDESDAGPRPVEVVKASTADEADEVEDEPAVEPLPDMSSMFTQVRAEAARATAAPGRNRRNLLAVAAAAVILVGGGTAIGYAVESAGTGSGQHVALGRFDIGHGSGTATIDGDTVSLAATSLPKLTASERYEVWLTDAARKHMYAIGFLGDGSSATFKVKRSYLDQYSDIEVSKQEAGKTKYSGVSVLRGSYST